MRGNSLEVAVGRETVAIYELPNIADFAVITNLQGFFLIVMISGKKATVVSFLEGSWHREFCYEYEFEGVVSSIISLRDVFVLIVEGQIRVCLLDAAGLRTMRARIDAQCRLIAAKGDFLWVISKEFCVTAYYLDRVRDEFNFVASRILPNQATVLRAIDDVTAIVGSSEGGITTLQIPSDVGHGRIEQYHGAKPVLNVLGMYLCGEALSDICVSPKKILYATWKGTVGALTPITRASTFADLAEKQTMIRKEYLRRFGLFRQSRRGIENAESVIDYDLFVGFSELEGFEELPFPMMGCMSELLNGLGF
jgi:hypothetical protein